jgi:hypothetical protein
VGQAIAVCGLPSRWAHKGRRQEAIVHPTSCGILIAGSVQLFSDTTLTQLYFGRNFRSYQGRSSVCVYNLFCDPPGVLGAEQSHHIADVLRSAQPPHRRPAASVPVPDQILNLIGQTVQNAVLRPARTDRVYGNSPLGQRDRKMTNERFHGRLGRTHADPRQQPAGAASLRIGDRDDSASTESCGCEIYIPRSLTHIEPLRRTTSPAPL